MLGSLVLVTGGAAAKGTAVTKSCSNYNSSWCRRKQTTAGETRTTDTEFATVIATERMTTVNNRRKRKQSNSVNIRSRNDQRWSR